MEKRGWEDGDEEREELGKGGRERIGEDSETGSVCGERGLDMIPSKGPGLQSQAHCLVPSLSTFAGLDYLFDLPEFIPSSDNWMY